MFITTAAAPSTKLIGRARAVAERCGAPYRPRVGAIEAMLQAAHSDLAYVVGRSREELRSAEAGLFVHAGMFAHKRDLAREHPFVRAVVRGGPCTSIVDATIGLAGDALHLAAVLGVPITGVEGSPAVYCLLEEGLSRLAAAGGEVGAAAARIRLQHGESCETLATMPADSADVVVLDPMFPVERPAAPGFALLRAVAHPGVDPQALIEPARRVARRHVVLKYPTRPTIPPCDDRIDGKALRYLVYEA